MLGNSKWKSQLSNSWWGGPLVRSAPLGAGGMGEVHRARDPRGDWVRAGTGYVIVATTIAIARVDKVNRAASKQRIVCHAHAKRHMASVAGA